MGPPGLRAPGRERTAQVRADESGMGRAARSEWKGRECRRVTGQPIMAGEAMRQVVERIESRIQTVLDGCKLIPTAHIVSDPPTSDCRIVAAEGSSIVPEPRLCWRCTQLLATASLRGIAVPLAVLLPARCQQVSTCNGSLHAQGPRLSSSSGGHRHRFRHSLLDHSVIWAVG